MSAFPRRSEHFVKKRRSSAVFQELSVTKRRKLSDGGASGNASSSSDSVSDSDSDSSSTSTSSSSSDEDDSSDDDDDDGATAFAVAQNQPAAAVDEFPSNIDWSTVPLPTVK